VKNLEYKVVLRPYDTTTLIGRAKGDAGTSEATYEAGDWNSSLNKYAKDGWVIKNSGTIVSGRDIVFWALLEKPTKGKAGWGEM
jgi:hypothetical protein